MSKQTERFNFVEEHGGAFQGKRELLKHLSGENITARQAIKAKCYDCMCFFEDGKQDCKAPNCPLYPFMAYREGGARKIRIISDEQKIALQKRIKMRSNAATLHNNKARAK